MTMKQALTEQSQANDYAAVYVDQSVNAPKCVPTKKRMRMIAKEMESLLDDAQDYLLKNLLDADMGDEAKNALLKAAMNSAYLKHKYDSTKNKVVFYPTCKDLILNHGMINSAEEFFYSEKDKFPAVYSEALEFVAREAERKIQIQERERRTRLEGNSSFQDSLSSFDEKLSLDITIHSDQDAMEELSNSWRELM